MGIGSVVTGKGGMTIIDREKIIKAVDEAFNMYESEYGGTSFFDEKEWAENKRDALFLLKEQEPALPMWSQGKAYCGKCGQSLPRKSADR